jgi:glutamine amidotransferase
VETGADPLFEGVRGLVAYFANSYFCVPESAADAIAWSEYDGMRSAAGVRCANTWGVQFHPEKSSGPGRRIISNFVGLARKLTKRAAK